MNMQISNSDQMYCEMKTYVLALLLHLFDFFIPETSGNIRDLDAVVKFKRRISGYHGNRLISTLNTKIPACQTAYLDLAHPNYVETTI